jgi:hypothetical protein
VGEVAEVVHRLVPVPPEKGFAAFKIHGAGTEREAVFQLLADLGIALAEGIDVIVDRTVLAREIALVGYEYDTLERGLPAEEPCPYEPPCEVAQLTYFSCHDRAKIRKESEADKCS